jgi:hypothetical protein
MQKKEKTAFPNLNLQYAKSMRMLECEIEKFSMGR